MDKSIALVGSNGPLGQYLSDYFVLNGWRLRRLSRSAASGATPVDVRVPPPPAVFHDVRAVVYCAWDTSRRSEKIQREHAEAAAVWASHAAAGDRVFIFASTVAADDFTPSTYGRYKATAEKHICASGGIAFRLGLVIDDSYPFFATALRRHVKRSPYLAAMCELPVFAVSSATVAEALADEIEAPRRGATVWVAPREPTSLVDVMSWGKHVRGPRLPALRWGAAVASWAINAGCHDRYLDALVGLAGGRFPSNMQCIVAPAAGPVSRSDWQRCLLSPSTGFGQLDQQVRSCQ